MCGIAGFLDRRGSHEESARDLLAMMTGSLRHRGPDAAGQWRDDAAGIALGHRRLAIIDLTPSGHQPMASTDDRWVIVFNGEIYNFERIKATLEAEGWAPNWKGHSDTEVLLAAISAWGVRQALDATIGMFAFALWDRRDRTLTLARDRAGEKPLFYGNCGPTLLFGSELKALRAHPSFDHSISDEAVAAYLRFGYVPSPFSIYRKIRKIDPGTFVVFGPGSDEPVTERFWQPPLPCPDPALNDCKVAEAELEKVLSDAVALQMRADVPMGAFLSGGIDSSLITALMQAQSPRPVRTFSIGFREAGYNEAHHASQIAGHLGTQHHELYVTSQDALEVVPLLPTIYDEPFADVSQIPTYLLSKLTRSHVTVALSGDAGDELFGGYARYLQADPFDRLLRRPASLRRLLRAGLMLPDNIIHASRRLLPNRIAGMLTGERLPKARAALECSDIYEVYRRLVSKWPRPHVIAPEAAEPQGWLDDTTLRNHVSEPADWMMAVDFRTYLPDDILVKVDRASMASSLETRVPMLDHRVVEFAARLPLEQKLRGGVGKLILRRLLDRHVPAHLIDRPKQGFAVPIGGWLRGELRDWAESVIASAADYADGQLDYSAVQAAWQRHLAGDDDMQHGIWTLLMYFAWRQSSA